MLRPKKVDTPLARLHLYLNYGLLSLATRLNERGHPVILKHGGFSDPLRFVDGIPTEYLVGATAPLLLSLPSSFAIGWAREFCAEIKRIAPQLRIVVGGRWVTATDGAWIRAQIPSVDLVVFGTAESRIERLIDRASGTTVPGTDRYLLGRGAPDDDVALPTLDFRLVEQFAAFQPCIEISRGCGMGCNFCAEADAPLGDLRPAVEVVDELLNLTHIYSGEIRPYFQASFFRPTSRWVEDLARMNAQKGLSVQWRAETRVDGLTPAQIEGLARTGLKVLDLGLESASPTQLRRMEKTTSPEVYLRRASSLLEACASNGVWTKVNVLLFPGESRATVDETVEWLERHRSKVKGVSVGPMIVFRYGEASSQYLDRIAEHGASAVNDGDLDRQGFAHLNLSRQMSHAESQDIARQISRMFMTQQDYFDLKSFSYFPRDFSQNQFSEVVASIPDSLLPFTPQVPR